MRHFFRDTSIRRKLTVLLMVASITVLFLSSVAFILSDTVAFWKAEKGNLSALADIIGNTASAAIAFNDQKAAQETLAGLSANPYILAVYIVTKEGALFAQYLRRNVHGDSSVLKLKPPADLIQEAKDSFWDLDLDLEVAKPILLDGQVIGTVVIQSTFGELASRLKSLLLIAALIMAGTLTVAFFLSAKLQHVISRPLLHLTQTMRAVAQRKDYSLRAKQESGDELGILINGFNEMLAQIQQRDEESVIQAEIGRIISSTLEIDQVYDRFAASVRRLVTFDQISICTIDSDRQSVTVAYALGVDRVDERPGSVLPLSPSEKRCFLQARSTVFVQAGEIDDIEEHFPFLLPAFRDGLRSMISVPLISKDQVIGTLNLRSFKVNAYTDRDVKTAESIGIQIGGAIANAVLFKERMRAEEALRESEEKFRQLAENIREVFYIYEQDVRRISYISPAYLEIWGRTPQSVHEKPQSFWDAVHPEDRDRVMKSHEQKGRGEVEEVYRIVRPDGSIRWIKDRSFPIYNNSGKTQRVVGIAADITDLKLGEEKLKYLSLHDPLTGLYNRIFFEEEMRRIEKGRYDTVGIVSCDVDGLKLVNDTLGHDHGDNLLVAAARAIQETFREGDLVARIGGDEFAVVLPNTTEAAVETACQRIQEAVGSYNATHPEFPLSISVGFAFKNGFHKTLKDVFEEADNHMYRKKLYRTQSVRSTLVKTLINTLKARDLTTEKHVIRLEKLLAGMAPLIGLPESAASDLSLLAKFHDIGKVGISDSILFKKGPLTPEEWTEMKRHPEIGYRIALSAPDLVPIADWILKHHEWWNGQGYPLGIKGEEIPIECRLLAIADAYEAMTSARPYRKAFSHAEALEELLSHSGTQFDPKLLEKFLLMLETSFPDLSIGDPSDPERSNEP